MMPEPVGGTSVTVALPVKSVPPKVIFTVAAVSFRRKGRAGLVLV